MVTVTEMVEFVWRMDGIYILLYVTYFCTNGNDIIAIKKYFDACLLHIQDKWNN